MRAVPGVRAVAVAVAATPEEGGMAEREAAEAGVTVAAAWEEVARAQVQ